MAGLILDSTIAIDLERGRLPPEVEDELGAAEDVALSAVTLSELLQGVHLADEGRRAQKEAFVEQITRSFPVIPFDDVAARVHARLAADLARKGTPVGALDLLIGAVAIANGRELWSADRRSFPKIPGLVLRVVVRAKKPR